MDNRTREILTTMGWSAYSSSVSLQMTGQVLKLKEPQVGYPLASASKFSLTLPLIFILLISTPPNSSNRRILWSLIALSLSWSGDSLPELFAKHRMVLKMILFLAAQCAYLIAFTPNITKGKTSNLSRAAKNSGSIRKMRTIPIKPRLSWLYNAAHLLVFLGILLSSTRRFTTLPPALERCLIFAYPLVLNAMQMAASTVNAKASFGAKLFILADTLLTVRELHPRWHLTYLTGTEMALYMLAQGLLIGGVVDSEKASRSNLR